MAKLSRKFHLLVGFFHHLGRYVDAPSYYPEKKRKSRLRRTFDMAWYIIKYGEYWGEYRMWGLDLKGSKMSDYLPLPIYREWRDKFNRVDQKEDGHLRYIWDKELFLRTIVKYTNRVYPILGVYDNGMIVNKDNNSSISLQDLLAQKHHLFLKPIVGEKGAGKYTIDFDNGVYFLNNVSSSLDEIINTLEPFSNFLIIQQRIIQHPTMSKMFSKSVNTIRISSILVDGKSHIIETIQRLGVGNNVVDNTSQGGVLSNVDENGFLSKYAMKLEKFWGKYYEHPDTKIKFEGFQIPYFKEAIELVKNVHEKYNYVPFVGWDICIAEDGPIIIEGNTQPDGDMTQAFHGMRETYTKYLKS